MPEKAQKYPLKIAKKQATRGFFRFHVLEVLLNARTALTVSEIQESVQARGHYFAWRTIAQAVVELQQLSTENFIFTESTKRVGIHRKPTRSFLLTLKTSS